MNKQYLTTAFNRYGLYTACFGVNLIAAPVSLFIGAPPIFYLACAATIFTAYGFLQTRKEFHRVLNQQALPSDSQEGLSDALQDSAKEEEYDPTQPSPKPKTENAAEASSDATDTPDALPSNDIPDDQQDALLEQSPKKSRRTSKVKQRKAPPPPSNQTGFSQFGEAPARQADDISAFALPEDIDLADKELAETGAAGKDSANLDEISKDKANKDTACTLDRDTHEATDKPKKRWWWFSSSNASHKKSDPNDPNDPNFYNYAKPKTTQPKPKPRPAPLSAPKKPPTP